MLPTASTALCSPSLYSKYTCLLCTDEQNGYLGIPAIHFDLFYSPKSVCLLRLHSKGIVYTICFIRVRLFKGQKEMTEQKIVFTAPRIIKNTFKQIHAKYLLLYLQIKYSYFIRFFFSVTIKNLSKIHRLKKVHIANFHK